MDTAAHPASTMPRYTATEAGVRGSMTATHVPVGRVPQVYNIACLGVEQTSCFVQRTTIFSGDGKLMGMPCISWYSKAQPPSFPW